MLPGVPHSPIGCDPGYFHGSSPGTLHRMVTNIQSESAIQEVSMLGKELTTYNALVYGMPHECACRTFPGQRQIVISPL